LCINQNNNNKFILTNTIETFTNTTNYKFTGSVISGVYNSIVNPVIPNMIMSNPPLPITGLGLGETNTPGVFIRPFSGYNITGNVTFQVVNPRLVLSYRIGSQAFVDSKITNFDFSGLDNVPVTFGTYVFVGTTIDNLRLPLSLTSYSLQLTSNVRFTNPMIDLSYLTKLVSIDQDAFANSNLKIIKLPVSVQTIDWSAFNGNGNNFNEIYLRSNRFKFIGSLDSTFYNKKITIYLWPHRNIVYTYDDIEVYSIKNFSYYGENKKIIFNYQYKKW